MSTVPPPQPLDTTVVRELARDHHLPGLVVGTLADGRITVTPVGVLDIETGRPLRDGSRFRAASITKLATAAAVMRLIERGVLDLESPVRRWLPGLPLPGVARDQLTLAHCLSHQAGFESDRLARPEYDDGEDADALRRMVDRFGQLTQWVPPGTTYCYSNHGFDLVGRVLESVTGQPYEEVIRTEVLIPLGMSATGFVRRGQPGPDDAPGHRIPDGGGPPTVVRSYGTTRRTDPSGGLVSTAGDLLRLGGAFLPSSLPAGFLASETIATMLTPRSGGHTSTTRHGLAWELRGEPLQRFGHTGTHPGFKSALTVVPDRPVAAVILTNAEVSGATMADIERRVVEVALGAPPVPPPAPIELPDVGLEALTGTYGGGPGQPVITILRDGGGLAMRRSGGPGPDSSATAQLEPFAPGRFRVAGGDRNNPDRAISFTHVGHPDHAGTWLYLGQALYRRRD